MKVCGQIFTPDIIRDINSTIGQHPSISRTGLAKVVCEQLGWRSTTGDWQLGSCRKALSQLDKSNIITLPLLTQSYSFQKSNPINEINFTLPEIVCTLNELGSIKIEPISSRRSKAGKLSRYLLDKFHYLGYKTFGGACIRYLLSCERYGTLGVFMFSSASYVLHNRDTYIGWSDNARLHNLNKVICNSRFLILPTVHVSNLASHALSLVLRRISDDWYTRYNIRPMLVETFVDPSQFDGTCYQAANWIWVGTSSGRRDGVAKDIYLYHLSRKSIDELCYEPRVILGEMPRSEESSTWAEEEFGTIRLHDERLKKRLYTIAEDMYSRPQLNIPESCQSHTRTTAAYRFFRNKKITMDIVLTPHLETTIERIKKHPVVLAPQDTTTLDYSTHPSTLGLGPTNNVAHTSQGFFLHDTLGFTPEGTPLGIIDAQCWARDPEDKGKGKRRNREPIEKKESIKWLRSYRKLSAVQELCPETMLVSIGDRESDVYDLIGEALKKPEGPKLLIRSEKTRNRKVDDVYLWDLMKKKAICGNVDISIPKRGNRKARVAHVAVSYSKVTLKPPVRNNHIPLKLWAVYIVEKESSDSGAPIEWLLLTTVAVDSFHDAIERVEWYSGRWGIEVYHRTLKSGCRIKDRQLGSVTRLENCLAIDMVVAWRIYHLTMLGREVPDHPCTVFFEEVEWKALYCYYTKSRELPSKPPTLHQAILLVGAIGGHLGRKRDGPPGTQSIWRGLQRLDTAVEMYCLFTKNKLPSYRKSFPNKYFCVRDGPESAGV